MKYLLDTDTCIYAMKGDENVLGRMLSARRVDVAISVITESELYVGAAKSHHPTKTRRRLDAFLKPIQRIVFTSKDAQRYGILRAQLEKAGKPIGPMDGFIAAHALSRELVLVSNNQREFKRVNGLMLENWKART